MHYFGDVEYGSRSNRVSWRDNTPSVSDWALIRISPERKGDNPVYGHGKSVCMRFHNALHGNPKQGETVYKSGRSTGLTEDRYGLPAVIITKGLDIHGNEVPVATFEHIVYGPSDKPFANPGDSGAFVYTKDTKVVGLLVGGAERVNAF